MRQFRYRKYKIDDVVDTMVGKGRVLGYAHTHSGTEVVIVHVPNSAGDRYDPHCVTPYIPHGAVWMYTEDELEFTNGK